MRNYLELSFDGQMIKLTTPSVIKSIVYDFDKKGREHKPTGKWITTADGRWLTCYDEYGNAYVEDFQHIEIALLYLSSNTDISTLYDMDKSMN